MKKTIVFISIIAVGFSCRKSQFDTVDRTEGTADFTRYVAVGNSLTQGFADGGVYAESQKYSYPALIAQQMAFCNEDMGDYLQPTVYGNGSGYIHLEYPVDELEVIQPGDPGGFAEDPSWAGWGVQGLPYNNLGISGITLDQCVALDATELTVNNAILGGIDASPFFVQAGNPFARFLDFGDNPFLGGTPIQYLDHIRNSQATFFTCWLGNNDILGYATSGGVSTSIDLSFIGFGVIEFNTLADPTEFRMKYDSVLTAFNSIGAKGICATIPDVTVIPFFNQFTVQSLKDDYLYTDVWIEEADGDVRIATDADLILLTAADTIEMGAGSSNTQYLEHALVLDAAEVAATQSATVAVNAQIELSAAQFDFAVVDMYTVLNDLKPGVTYDGVEITPAYIQGAGFSLDGIHLTPKGYAMVANEYIKAINTHYGSNIPTLAINEYRGIVFP